MGKAISHVFKMLDANGRIFIAAAICAFSLASCMPHSANPVTSYAGRFEKSSIEERIALIDSGTIKKSRAAVRSLSLATTCSVTS
ncbi:MAG: hypothetical protein O7D29_04905, partial [Gemmatimonadetes bacterium]|nr:hypothetical protein [Gemmatimonadota bacterium]